MWEVVKSVTTCQKDRPSVVTLRYIRPLEKSSAWPFLDQAYSSPLPAEGDVVWFDTVLQSPTPS